MLPRSVSRNMTYISEYKLQNLWCRMLKSWDYGVASTRIINGSPPSKIAVLLCSHGLIVHFIVYTLLYKFITIIIIIYAINTAHVIYCSFTYIYSCYLITPRCLQCDPDNFPNVKNFFCSIISNPYSVGVHSRSDMMENLSWEAITTRCLIYMTYVYANINTPWGPWALDGFTCYGQ